MKRRAVLAAGAADRYVVKPRLISRMEVWNDSAEWLLVRAGLATL